MTIFLTFVHLIESIEIEQVNKTPIQQSLMQTQTDCYQRGVNGGKYVSGDWELVGGFSAGLVGGFIGWGRNALR